MSQDSVLKYLRKQRKWKSTKEIAKAVGVQSGCTLNSLNALFKYKEILRKQGIAKYKQCYYWRTI